MVTVVVLTDRTKQIIRLSVLSGSTKQAALSLGITTNTLKTLLYRLRDKLGRFERIDLPGMALALGVVTPEELIESGMVFLKDRPQVKRRKSHLRVIQSPQNASIHRPRP